MCITEQSLRRSNSQVYGCIINKEGPNWQVLANTIHELAVVYGQIVQIKLVPSNTNDWLDFQIWYDKRESAGKLCHHMEVLNKINPIGIQQLSHVETPPLSNNN